MAEPAVSSAPIANIEKIMTIEETSCIKISFCERKRRRLTIRQLTNLFIHDVAEAPGMQKLLTIQSVEFRRNKFAVDDGY